MLVLWLSRIWMQLSYKDAAEVCFSRRMQLVSFDTDNEREFFRMQRNTRFLESGEYNVNSIPYNQKKLKCLQFRSKHHVDLCRCFLHFQIPRKLYRGEMVRHWNLFNTDQSNLHASGPKGLVSHLRAYNKPLRVQIVQKPLLLCLRGAFQY